jgi:hypothetical protein
MIEDKSRTTMKKAVAVIVLLALFTGLLNSLAARAQQKVGITPNLTALVGGKGGTAVNRSVTALNEGDKKGVRLNEREGEGIVWLENVQFSNGVIEFDVRGKDVLQQSFLGVAFHGLDDKTYDAIYFRPFNFRSEDPVRRVHAVQYISHPEYNWQRLRGEYPNKYEAAVSPAPDPNGWFHVRVVVASPKVNVFVNQGSATVLAVEQLSKRPGGRVGLWVGNNSGGDFANLTITPAQ